VALRAVVVGGGSAAAVALDRAELARAHLFRGSSRLPVPGCWF
jgi:hypothetical protein